MDHGFGCFGVVLVVFGETALPVEPAEGAFDNPAFGQNLEGMQFRTFDDLKNVAEHGLTPIDNALFITAIEKDFE